MMSLVSYSNDLYSLLKALGALEIFKQKKNIDYLEKSLSMMQIDVREKCKQE